MIIEAEEHHTLDLARMTRDMYKELFPAHAVSDLRVYINEVTNSFDSPKDTIFIDSELKGFFIVREETEAMAPTLVRYNGFRVYIAKEYRKTRLLAEFYSKLFETFPDGDILGVTEIHSQHIAVLNKRHVHIANVYKLRRT